MLQRKVLIFCNNFLCCQTSLRSMSRAWYTLQFSLALATQQKNQKLHCEREKKLQSLPTALVVSPYFSETEIPTVQLNKNLYCLISKAIQWKILVMIIYFPCSEKFQCVFVIFCMNINFTKTCTFLHSFRSKPNVI